MKYAFSTLSCPGWSIEQVATEAVRMGYDAVELRLLDGEVIDPIKHYAKVVASVALCRSHGIEVCALDTSCRFNLSSSQERIHQVAELLAWIALAHETRVPILRIFGGMRPQDALPTASEQEENVWMADSLRSVVSQAEQAMVTVALETHDAFSSAHRVAEVLQLVGSPRITALWDSHHPYRVGESAQEVMAALQNRISHVHVKDARRTTPGGSDWQLLLLGEGEVPVREQLRILKQHHYDAYVSVEWEKKWHPEIPEPEIALPQHIAWLKQNEVDL